MSLAKRAKQLERDLKNCRPDAKVEVWQDETDNTIGVSLTEDGLTQVAYFDEIGHIIGDWQ